MSGDAVLALAEIKRAASFDYVATRADGERWERLGLGRMKFIDGALTFDLGTKVESVDAHRKLLSIAGEVNGVLNAEGDPKKAVERIADILGAPF